MEGVVGVGALIDALIERDDGSVNHPDDKCGPTRFGIRLRLGTKAKADRNRAGDPARRAYQLGRWQSEADLIAEPSSQR